MATAQADDLNRTTWRPGPRYRGRTLLAIALAMSLAVATPAASVATDGEERHDRPSTDSTGVGETVSTRTAEPSERSNPPRAARQGDFVEIFEVPESELSDEWTERTVDLAPWAGEEVCLAFVYQGAFGHIWYLDDIEVVSDGDVILDESFDDETYPPEGWARVSVGDQDRRWERAIADANSGPASTWHNWGPPDRDTNSWLVTPPLALGDDAELTYFDHTLDASFYTYSGVWLSTADCEPRTQPRIELDPEAVTVTVDPGEGSAETAVIRNDAVGTLEWQAVDDPAEDDCDAIDDVSWLTMTPTAGSVEASLSDELVLTFDSAGLDPRPHRASVCIDSNDPVRPRITLSVIFRVLEEPGLGLEPQALTATQPVDHVTDDTLAITNTRHATLDWQMISGAPPVSYENGPLITTPGAGPGGADLSEVQDQSLGMNLFGSSISSRDGRRVADQFVVDAPGGWTVDTLRFYAYESGSTTESTFDHVDYRIWDGPPNSSSSNVVVGDTSENRLIDTSWTNAYRVLESDPEDLSRPVMEVVAEGGFSLDEGTYWLDWSLDGVLDSPWQPPTTIVGELETGEALHFLGTLWTPVIDSVTTFAPQGKPFGVDGRWSESPGCESPDDIPWFDTAMTAGQNGPGVTTDVAVTFDSRGLPHGVYEALVCLVTNDAEAPFVELPVRLDVVSVASLDVQPSDSTIELGATQPLSASAVHDDGSSVDVTESAEWSSSDVAVATVTEGVVTGVAEGVVEVTAAFGGESGTATVTVVADDDDDDPEPPGPPGPPDPGEPLPEGVVRVAGSNRFETAITISQATFGDGEAGSVVLARGDDFADSLAGTPLAVDRDAPVLLTVTDTLIDVVADEIGRVLPAGGTVYLLGGTAALDASVEADLVALGYTPVRLAGPERIGTSLAVANELAGDPGEILITNGFNFPDALAAGAAGAEVDGVVILTTPDTPDAQVDAFLAANPTATITAVGGPAARAYPDATPVFGPTRETTAVAVAETFFDTPAAIAIARQDDFADALAGGAHIGRLGGPLLLTPDVVLHPDTEAYLCANAESITTGFVYGGTAAVSADVSDLIGDAIDGLACP